MPNHFQLVDKTTGEPEAFNAVDAKLCEHFRAPVHPTEWFNGWYACIGFGLACGKAFAELRATYAQYAEAGGEEFDRRMVEIIDWLAARYEPRAWATVGK